MAKSISKSVEAHEAEPVSLSERIHRHVRVAIETAVHEELRAALGTTPYERSEVRRSYRNGTKARTLTGPTGPISLKAARRRDAHRCPSLRDHRGSRRRPSGDAVEDVAHFPDQRVFREWLLQEDVLGVEDPVMRDGAVGVAGHVEHAQPRARRCQLFGVLA